MQFDEFALFVVVSVDRGVDGSTGLDGAIVEANVSWVISWYVNWSWAMGVSVICDVATDVLSSMLIILLVILLSLRSWKICCSVLRLCGAVFLVVVSFCSVVVASSLPFPVVVFCFWWLVYLLFPVDYGTRWWGWTSASFAVLVVWLQAFLVVVRVNGDFFE